MAQRVATAQSWHNTRAHHPVSTRQQRLPPAPRLVTRFNRPSSYARLSPRSIIEVSQSDECHIRATSLKRETAKPAPGAADPALSQEEEAEMEAEAEAQKLRAQGGDLQPPEGEESKILAIIVWGGAARTAKALDGGLGTTLDLMYDTQGAAFKGSSHSLAPGQADFGR